MVRVPSYPPLLSLLNITRGKKLEEREEEGNKKMIEEVPSAFGVAFELVEVRY